MIRKKHCIFIIFMMCAVTLWSKDVGPSMKASQEKLKAELMAKYGETARPRITTGITQVADFWRKEDGDAKAFEDFVRANFIGDQKTLDETFNRLQYTLEQLDGYLHDVNLEFRRQADLDIGPILPLDETLGGYDPWAHINDDFFDNKVAFIVLLNFPLSGLDERLEHGKDWSRRQWAEARLTERFSKRIPASVNLEVSKSASEAAEYIAEYNIWMHHVLDAKGNRLFPPKMRLLSHWNLRDELKADYSDPNGLPKQRMIQKVMERIVTQTIPRVVINNPAVDWNPESNQVTASAEKDSDEAPPSDLKVVADREPDTRYERLLNNFRAGKKVDPYSPTNPTLVARSFNEDRQIPEERVKKMFDSVLAAPVVSSVAGLIQKRLGRDLEPFDIWYNGFRPREKYTEAQLDEIVAKKYPTSEAYAADIPNLLQKLGFSKEKAAFVATNIVVDPARGSGHAWGAERRGDKAHLRTRVEKTGMNYKGYNIAVHEMGHNVEQTFSLNEIDHTLLHGVPNTAFTEALAFVFQGHDLELLGLSKPDASSQAMKTLNDFWRRKSTRLNSSH